MTLDKDQKSDQISCDIAYFVASVPDDAAVGPFIGAGVAPAARCGAARTYRASDSPKTQRRYNCAGTSRCPVPAVSRLSHALRGQRRLVQEHKRGANRATVTGRHIVGARTSETTSPYGWLLTVARFRIAGQSH
jgi:hypothetical protein